MAEDEDIYDVAPGNDDKVVSFRALKDTWNTNATAMTSPAPLKSPAHKIPGAKPFLPAKEGPAISLEVVQKAKSKLHEVPNKRESANRGSKIAIPAAFGGKDATAKPSTNLHNKPMPKPKPKPGVLLRKEQAANGSVPQANGAPPSVPPKSAGGNRKTLDPGPHKVRPPPADPSTVANTPKPDFPSQKSAPGAKVGDRDSKRSSSSKPVELRQKADVITANGKKYKKLSLPAVRGVGPIKPARPPDVKLPLGEIVGSYDDDDELYDEVVTIPQKSRSSRTSGRPVSEIPEYTEEEEEKFEKDVVPRPSIIDDDDLYDTVDDLRPQDQEGEIYDDDMVMNPMRDSATGSLYEAFDDVIETYEAEQKSSSKKK